MRTLQKTLYLLMALALPVQADIAVVVHPSSTLKELSREQVSDLYLGRLVSSVALHAPQLFDQPRESDLRRRFFTQLNGMDVLRLNAYWARLQFSGDKQPPLALDGSREVLSMVANNRNAIGYIDAEAVTGNVRVILRLKD